MGRPPNEPDPSAGPLALFASEHRRYRKTAGISQADLAVELVYTPQFVGMVEVAARTPGWKYVGGADRVLGAGGGLISCWKLVARMHIPKWFGPFIDVEAKAVAMREWELAFIPGLLQTAEYAHALTRAARPNTAEEQIEQEVDVRMHRQEILHHADPPMFWAIIDENAFRRPVGDPEIMREQCAHLLKMADLPHIDIQILPYDAGAHPGQIGAFTILELDAQPEIVWMEGPDGGHFHRPAGTGCHLYPTLRSPSGSGPFPDRVPEIDHRVSGGDMGTPDAGRFTWRKSSHSSGEGGQCVEVGAAPDFIGIRDTKNRARGHLTVGPKTWSMFIASRYVTGS